ncbi:MAG: RNase adapter RapZ [Bacteroidales bacterium]
METLNNNPLAGLVKKWSGEEAVNIIELPESGSYRRYFRLFTNSKTVVGVINKDEKENRAFIEFSKHFRSKGLPVPEIYADDLKNDIYLQEDLGDTTLYSWLSNVKKGIEFSDDIILVYKKVLDELLKFQVKGAEGFNYSYCYPRAAFDKQSMMWDLNYFKYYFLKLAKIPFDEQDLENDFQRFTDFLLEADCNYFLYRDFQSRNVMLKDNIPYFIDYQGGRKGALQYDLASLLYDSKADIPQETRNELKNYYVEALDRIKPGSADTFNHFYAGYSLIRLLQAMGAYGFRGFYEKKTHFLQSIPYAVQNLEYLLDAGNLPSEFNELWAVLRRLTKSEELSKFKNQDRKLKVQVFSFSYKKGLPTDDSGNGGGFVFDCRAIHNPGRYDEFLKLTGRDQEVIDFFEKEEEMTQFLQSVYQVVDQSVEKYLKRGFTNLMLSFGCTGGQHRSVYAAEQTSKHLKLKFDINIVLNHREQGLVFQ